MHRQILKLSALLLFACGTTAWAVDEYRLDDGVADQNFGITGGGSMKASLWFNRFVADAGKETITDINVAFGSIPSNFPISVHLWGDFNNDGNPNDAFLLSSASGTVQSPNTNTLITYDISDVTLNVGDYFYVGTIIENYTSSHMPMALDLDGNDDVITYPPNDHSWVAGQTDPANATIDPSNITNTQLPLALVNTAFGNDGNWLIRANAVPEPLSLALLAFGLLLLPRRR